MNSSAMKKTLPERRGFFIQRGYLPSVETCSVTTVCAARQTGLKYGYENALAGADESVTGSIAEEVGTGNKAAAISRRYPDGAHFVLDYWASYL